MPKSKAAHKEPVGPCDKLPGSLRELAQQVFSKRDPVQLACRLLDDGSDAVKARTFEELSGWAFGKEQRERSEAGPPSPTVRIICDIPRPPYERSSGE